MSSSNSRGGNKLGAADTLESVRDRILEVTMRLVAVQGIHRTSLAAIAREAKISRGTLFYYFPSKQGLLYQVMEDSFAKITARVMQAIAGMEPGSNFAEIFALTLSSVGESRHLNQLYFHLFQEAISGDDTLKKHFQESYGRWQKILKESLERHFPKTSIQYSSAALSSLFLALIEGISIQALLNCNSLHYGEIAAALTALFQEDEQGR